MVLRNGYVFLVFLSLITLSLGTYCSSLNNGTTFRCSKSAHSPIDYVKVDNVCEDRLNFTWTLYRYNCSRIRGPRNFMRSSEVVLLPYEAINLEMPRTREMCKELRVSRCFRNDVKQVCGQLCDITAVKPVDVKSNGNRDYNEYIAYKKMIKIKNFKMFFKFNLSRSWNKNFS